MSVKTLEVGATFDYMEEKWIVTWVGYDGWYKAVSSSGAEKKFAPDTWWQS